MHPTSRLTGAWALAVCGLALAGLLGGCATEDKDSAGGAGPTPVAPASSSAGSLSPERAEAVFLDATAAHLCAVQSRVYTDPKALADAYQSSPPIADLTPAQVTAFNARVSSDSAFATELTDRVRRTCGTAPSASPSS
jgi:hypothetical protein